MRKTTVLVMLVVICATVVAFDCLDCSARGRGSVIMGNTPNEGGWKRIAELKQEQEELKQQFEWVLTYIFWPLAAISILILIASFVWASDRVNWYFYTHPHPIRSWLKRRIHSVKFETR